MNKELEKLESSKEDETYSEKRVRIFFLLVTILLILVTTFPAMVVYFKNVVANFFGQ